jgi:hypothetical protein
LPDTGSPARRKRSDRKQGNPFCVLFLEQHHQNFCQELGGRRTLGETVQALGQAPVGGLFNGMGHAFLRCLLPPMVFSSNFKQDLAGMNPTEHFKNFT